MDLLVEKKDRTMDMLVEQKVRITNLLVAQKDRIMDLLVSSKVIIMDLQNLQRETKTYVKQEDIAWKEERQNNLDGQVVENKNKIKFKK